MPLRPRRNVLLCRPEQLLAYVYSCQGQISFEQRKKHEKEEGRSGWAAFRWKRDILERMSIAIAKGNWALLDAHTPAPRV